MFFPFLHGKRLEIDFSKMLTKEKYACIEETYGAHVSLIVPSTPSPAPSFTPLLALLFVPLCAPMLKE